MVLGVWWVGIGGVGVGGGMIDDAFFWFMILFVFWGWYLG